MVYARSIGDTTLTLLVSGKLWRNSLIMQDEETGTLWSHVSGRAMDGPLAGRQLPSVPSVQTTWSAWKAAHPETRVLKKSEAITSSRYEKYFADPDRAGIFRTAYLRDRMSAKTLVHGLAVGAHAVAVSDSALVAGTSREVTVGDETVVVTRDADGGVRARTQDGGEVQVRTAFWFAWSAFYPNTAVVE